MRRYWLHKTERALCVSCGKDLFCCVFVGGGIPIYKGELLLLFFILFTLVGAIGALGDTGTFVEDPQTGLQRAVIPSGRGLNATLGLKEGGPVFGFTKANEVFVGRLAQLGFAFSLVGEIITGKGALAQLNVIFFFFAALNLGWRLDASSSTPRCPCTI